MIKKSLSFIFLCLSLSFGSIAQATSSEGICGAADEVMTNTAPQSDLCAKGFPSKPSGNGPWIWSCGGEYGGTPALCAAPSDKIFHPQDYTDSVSDCNWNATEDVAPCIQAAIQDASKVGGSVDIPSGTWSLGKSLSMPSHVTIEGDNVTTTTLIPTINNVSNQLLLTGHNINHVLIRNITFDGGGPDFENPYGPIGVTTGDHVIFDNIAVQNSHGIGLLLQGGISNSGVKNSSFKNIGNHWKTTFQRADRIQGLVFCCGTNTNNFATGNYFEDIGLDALQPSSQNGFVATYNIFKLENNQRALVRSGDYASAIFPMQSSNVVIANNTITGAQGNGIDAPGLQNSSIYNNTISNSGSAGIGLFLGYNKTTPSSNITISNNKILNNAQWNSSCFTGGITMNDNASYINISNNIISDTQAVKTQRYGIQWVESCGMSTNTKNVTINDNTIADNSAGPLDNFSKDCKDSCTYNGTPSELYQQP